MLHLEASDARSFGPWCNCQMADFDHVGVVHRRPSGAAHIPRRLAYHFQRRLGWPGLPRHGGSRPLPSDSATLHWIVHCREACVKQIATGFLSPSPFRWPHVTPFLPDFHLVAKTFQICRFSLFLFPLHDCLSSTAHFYRPALIMPIPCAVFLFRLPGVCLGLPAVLFCLGSPFFGYLKLAWANRPLLLLPVGGV